MKTLKSCQSLALLGALITVLGTSLFLGFDNSLVAVVHAQEQATPTPTPDEVLEQAKREAALADELKKKALADQERVEAENAKLKAQTQPLGTATVTVPTGSVQTDAAGWVESQMLAQEAAKHITERLAIKLCTGKFLNGGIADSIAGEAAPTQAIDTLVIYNNNDLAGIELYATIHGQLSQLKTEFTTENPKATSMLAATDPRVAGGLAAFPILAAPAVASGAIKSVAEVLNLFRTDTSFQNKSVQISEDMVVSRVAEYFGNSGLAPGAAVGAAAAASRCNQAVKLYYPSLFPPKLTKSSASSQLLTLLNQVEGEKNTAAGLLDQTEARIKDITNLRGVLAARKKSVDAKAAKDATLAVKKEELKKCRTASDCKRIRAEIKELEKDIAELVKAIGDIDSDFGADKPAIMANAPNFKDWLAKLADQKTQFQARITATELLAAKLNTPDATTKLTALAQLLRAEKLNDILKSAQTFTLRVAVAANGTTKVKKNMFVDAKVRHSAGANVVYQLFNRDGALAQADVMQCYVSYQSSQDVEKIVTGTKTVECRSN